MRIARSVGSLILPISILTACAPAAPQTAVPTSPATAPASTRPITITFENYNLASAGLGRDATLKMIAEFKQIHPEITVETKATPDPQMFSSVQAQVVAGNPPDIAQLLLREWDQNIENLPVKTLTDFVPQDELAAHLGGAYPIHPKAVALTERNGKLQGLPYVFSTPTLFYNKSLLKSAGFDPEQPPRTWDDVRKTAKVIKDKTGNDGLYIACIENDWCAQGVVLSNGGRVMAPDRSKLFWTEPGSLEVYRFWQGMTQEGGHSKLSAADAQDAFQNGRVGMLLNTSAIQSVLLKSAEGKFELGATGMPSFGSKPAVPTNSGSSLAILASDPDKQRAAWELMKFLTSERAFQIITSEIGYLPLRTGIIKDEKYLKDWVAKNPQILPNIEQMDQLSPSLSYPGQNSLQIRKLYLTTLQQVLFEGADVDKSFKDAEARATAFMP